MTCAPGMEEPSALAVTTPEILASPAMASAMLPGIKSADARNARLKQIWRIMPCPRSSYDLIQFSFVRHLGLTRKTADLKVCATKPSAPC